MKKIFTSLLFWILNLSLIQVCYAASFDEELTKAQKGDVKAELNICDMYRLGKDVNKDIRKAQTWCRKAAATGNAKAQFAAGFIASGWYPETTNYEEAISLWKKSAAQGNQDAIYHLGLAYEQGKLIPQNFSEAARWYREGVKSGSIPFQKALGNLLIKSDDSAVVTDGLGYLRQAAHKGDADANYSLCFWYKKNSNKFRDVSKALPFCEVAAKQGDARAMFDIGTIYALGNGIPKNPERAALFFQNAAELGNTSAILALGMLYEQGNGVGKDMNKAIELYKDAARRGHPLAKAKLNEKNINF